MTYVVILHAWTHGPEGVPGEHQFAVEATGVRAAEKRATELAIDCGMTDIRVVNTVVAPDQECGS